MLNTVHSFSKFSLISSVSDSPGHYESEDPYPSLSDYHDYEPQLEFDDSELLEQKPEDLGDEGRGELDCFQIF